MSDSKLIVLCAGSFQGKSLAALRLAARLKFSAVISTDFVRNVLQILSPEKMHLSTSSYCLSSEMFTQQVNEVSEVIKDLVAIYRSRGEHIILEGIHFNENFIAGAATENTLILGFDNQLPLEKRVVLKTITRSKLRMIDEKNDQGFHVTAVVNDGNVHNSMYIRNQDRIKQIHDNAIKNIRKHKFQVIAFTDLEKAIEEAYLAAQSWQWEK